MSTAAVVSRQRGTRGNGSWTGTMRMARLDLRTGFVELGAWPLAMAGLVLATVQGVKGLYPDEARRQLYQATVGNSPTSVAFNGRGYNLDSLGGITAYEVGFFGLLFLPVIAAHLAIRHTRTQEDAGRAELVTATRVGRRAPVLAAALVVTAALLLTGVLTAALLVVSGLPGLGSAYYAAALVLHMLVFMSVGLLAGQVSQTGRGAHSMALAVIGGFYLVRAVIDGRGWDAAWATPLGWLAEVQPFGDLQLWPYLSLAACSVALFLATVWVCGRRDVGAGLVAPRPGPAAASKLLRGPSGLIWRITRGTLYGWGFGTATWGLALGLLSQEAGKMIASNPALADAFGGSSTTPEDLMTSLAGVLIALLASAVGLQGLARLSGEESSGRLGLVLSARFTRTRWWLSSLGLIALQILLVLIAGGIGYGVGVVLTAGQLDQLGVGLVACLAYYPATLLVGMIGGVLLAFSCRIAALSWFLLVWSAIVAMLADTIRLPGWLRDLSPLEHTGRVPVGDLDVTAVIVMAAVTLVLAAASTLVLRRRDLAAG